MAHRYKLDFDGQSVVQDDYNSLAIEASTGEDHVYAELFRLAPYDGSTARGVIPYASATITPSGADASVLVHPFRAVIGSRTAVGTDAVENWQDVRSSLSIADGATSLVRTVTLGANATGNPRWDAIYASVTIDSVSTPTTRKVKNPGTGVVTDESVSIYSRTAVNVAVAAGTAGASPAFPSIPSDAGDVYYVLLCYVRVPNGFNGTSTVANKDINEVAPIIAITRATGASMLRPANQSYATGGTAISSAGTSTPNGTLKWLGTTAQRPGVYMPPSMVGMESRIIAIDLANASSANWSHQNGAILDDSVDWRKRVFKWMAKIGGPAANDSKFPWNSSGGQGLLVGDRSVPSAGSADLSAEQTYQLGFGQSFAVDAVSGTLTAAYFKATTDGANLANAGGVMAASTVIAVYVDASTGALKLGISGVPAVCLFLWLDATAPYGNA